MMYFTTHLNAYTPKNRACAELNEWIKDYKNVLFRDELSLDAFKEEVHHKIVEINAKCPKLRPISASVSNNQIRASIPTSCGIPDEVFILSYAKVRSTYVFAEPIPSIAIEAKEGGKNE